MVRRNTPRPTREAELLTVAETAQVLGVSPQWLYKLIARNAAPLQPMRLSPNGQYRFSRRQLERYVAGEGGVAS